MFYDEEKYAALIADGQIRTWADGFGRWYAEVSAHAAAPKPTAVGAIWHELRQRSNDVPPRPVVERAPEYDKPGRVVYRETDA